MTNDTFRREAESIAQARVGRLEELIRLLVPLLEVLPQPDDSADVAPGPDVSRYAHLTREQHVTLRSVVPGGPR